VPFVAETNKVLERVAIMTEYKQEVYWNDIPTDKKDAVTYDVLCLWWHMSERNVRIALHELSRLDNGDNYVLIRSSKNRGFYKTDNKEEIEAYKQECLNRGRNVFAPIKKINRILRANDTQYSFVNNLRVIRESRNLKQTSVCAYMKTFDEGFDVPMLSKMENGVCLPTPYQLARLAEFYGCEPSELVDADFFY
jgi:hypothetical protein